MFPSGMPGHFDDPKSSNERASFERSQRVVEAIADESNVIDLGPRAEQSSAQSLVPMPPRRARELPDPEPPDREIRTGDVDPWGRSERVRSIARRMYDPLYRYW
ncbi:MAG: hypothetical protein F2877_07745, partial [Actinobacteria bacterium]|nr:hypothetical protein [Actinomycetota bacterium]